MKPPIVIKRDIGLKNARNALPMKKRKNNQNRNANTASNDNDSPSYSFTARDTKFGDSWIGDSRADHHIVKNHNSFTEYFPVLGQHINGVGGIKTPIHGHGTVHVEMRSGLKSNTVALQDCYHIPSNDRNLLSLRCFDQSGGTIKINSN